MGIVKPHIGREREGERKSTNRTSLNIIKVNGCDTLRRKKPVVCMYSGFWYPWPDECVELLKTKSSLCGGFT